MSEPKISVIIPLFNAERFIRQCLISVLASKFTDYEVIVVDDCSTDNSVAEVEKLLPHFDGRLKILSTEKNSGGPGIPRNVGIKNSAGKYVTFVDNDDMILPNALGDFFAFAEKFQADVVDTEKYLAFNDTGKITFTWKEIFLLKNPYDEFVNAPFMESKKLDERIRRYVRGKFFWLPWGKFYRRDFLLANKIDFPQKIKFGEDMVFCFKCMCLAENYLRVPNVTNLRRLLQESASRYVCTPHEGTEFWLKSLTTVTQSIDEFMNNMDFFRENPDARRNVLKYCIDEYFSFHKNIFRYTAAHNVQKIFFDVLQNPKLNQTGKNLIAAYLYAERVLTR